MPTLSRFIVACIILAALGYSAYFALANFIHPTPHEIILRVSTDKLLKE